MGVICKYTHYAKSSWKSGEKAGLSEIANRGHCPSGVRRKFSWGFHSVAYGGYLYFVCVVCDVTIWCRIHVSKPTFWRRFLTQYAYSSTRTLLVCYCTECKLSALQVRISEEDSLNATTQQFKTPKISGLALKQGSKTHSSLSQNIYNYNICIKSTN